MSSRAQILGTLRRGLGRGPLAEGERDQLEARIAGHRRNLQPERAKGAAREELIQRFCEYATLVQTTIDRVPSLEAVPDCVAAYLANHNLPARLRAATDPTTAAIPWTRRPTLEVREGRAEESDLVSVTSAVAAVAETGTLVLASGPEHPTTLNFLPDDHVVVLPASRLVGAYEDAFDVLRDRGPLPRAVNFVTGPSRTGDIEGVLILGAHGPRRLHIILVDD